MRSCRASLPTTHTGRRDSLKLRRHTAWLVVALFAVGCGDTPNVKKVYSDKSFVGPVNKLLIVGIHEDRNTRGRFERLLANGIVEIGGSARAISSEIGTAEALDEDVIARVARDTASDGVLVTRVKSRESKVEVSKGRTDVRVDRKNEGLADFFRYDYTDISDPDEVSLKQKVILISDVYTVDQGDKIWTIESTSFSRGDFTGLMEESVQVIAAQLRKDRIIRR